MRRHSRLVPVVEHQHSIGAIKVRRNRHRQAPHHHPRSTCSIALSAALRGSKQQQPALLYGALVPQWRLCLFEAAPTSSWRGHEPSSAHLVHMAMTIALSLHFAEVTEYIGLSPSTPRIIAVSSPDYHRTPDYRRIQVGLAATPYAPPLCFMPRGGLFQWAPPLCSLPDYRRSTR